MQHALRNPPNRERQIKSRPRRQAAPLAILLVRANQEHEAARRCAPEFRRRIFKQDAFNHALVRIRCWVIPCPPGCPRNRDVAQGLKEGCGGTALVAAVDGVRKTSAQAGIAVIRDHPRPAPESGAETRLPSRPAWEMRSRRSRYGARWLIPVSDPRARMLAHDEGTCTPPGSPDQSAFTRSSR